MIRYDYMSIQFSNTPNHTDFDLVESILLAIFWWQEIGWSYYAGSQRFGLEALRNTKKGHFVRKMPSCLWCNGQVLTAAMPMMVCGSSLTLLTLIFFLCLFSGSTQVLRFIGLCCFLGQGQVVGLSFSYIYFVSAKPFAAAIVAAKQTLPFNFFGKLQKRNLQIQYLNCVKYEKSYSHFCVKNQILVTCCPISMHWILIAKVYPFSTLLQFSSCVKYFTSDSNKTFYMSSRPKKHYHKNHNFWAVTGVITSQ